MITKDYAKATRMKDLDDSPRTEPAVQLRWVRDQEIQMRKEGPCIEINGRWVAVHKNFEGRYYYLIPNPSK